ncbi:L-seryl-tRNA(Ser) seleniumtransferase [Desulfosalsimonas propionicica]|uniref:L-seryl-tRNA(Sec) selenium transferase n=1 Tax=Desulfosalsimonas propionicica TaxID=332175 RepID=A0A7W0HJF6_9BACT|nr:L-seryl-tRNA(Sec) selenium transferase [Desulfosalsimonas propionicica]MBA2880145.1 L-seryl-tRNA(Ser) seleniumtransferase [Desulfosalsimonas propionicica]
MSGKNDQVLPNDRQAQLRRLPSVESMLEAAAEDPQLADAPRSVVKSAVRRVLDAIRKDLVSRTPPADDPGISKQAIFRQIRNEIQSAMAENLTHVINATGVVVHTNLGRSILSQKAMAHMTAAAGRYSNLEFNLAEGRRGSRYEIVEDLICELTGAEAAMAVNNNAGAVLLCLDTVARGREVVVSRGELVEIGGAFRIPDVMAKSGAILREVGTTNRTHRRDYESAISENTGLLLKVHTSNYGIVGFTASVGLKDMAQMGKQAGVPVMEDLGSGTLVDFSRYGLSREPTVQESVAAGADIVTFSGDKLLGGPQAGIIAGSGPVMEKIKKNPLTRALRIDKLTLAALESTLRAYRDEASAMQTIPTLYMLTCPLADIREKAKRLTGLLGQINDDRLTCRIIDSASRAGGGSLPLLELPTRCVAISIKDMSAARMDQGLRQQRPAVTGRIESDTFLVDLRTVLSDEVEMISRAVNLLLSGSSS